MLGTATPQFGRVRLPRPRPQLVGALLAPIAAGLAALSLATGDDAGRSATAFTPAPLSPAATQPLAFVPNRGQTDPRVRYEARAGDTAFFFTDRGATVALPGERGALAPPAVSADGSSVFGATGYALRLGLVGPRPGTTVTADGRAAGTVSYLGGPHEQAALPTYARLAYAGVWPGIDVSMASGAGQLKYAFAVAPGADPAAIGLGYAGAQSLAVAPDGSLAIATPRGPVTDTAPTAWQTIGGRRVDVGVRYRLDGGTRYGFALGAHDPAVPLTIDPGIVYSTFLGGSEEDIGWAAAMDASGNAYITGETASTDFPTTAGAFNTEHNGGFDAYVTKLAPDGASLVYSTFLGGGGFDRADGIAVDAAGGAYVAGRSNSLIANEDALVVKLAADGASLVWARFLGGSGSDEGEDIAVDALGNSYVTGQTFSSDFPTTVGAYDTTHNASGEGDLFVAKLDPDGGTLWSTFLGGEEREGGGGIVGGIDVDSTGAPVVVNETSSNDYPTTAGALDTTGGGGTVTKLAPDGASLEYSTFLGGAGSTELSSVRVGPDDAAYVVGDTNDSSFPVTAGAYDTTRNSQDAVVAKLADDGSLGYATYLGGALTEQGAAIDVDGLGSAYVTGNTESADFPTTPDGFDTTLDTDPGFDDGFVTKLSADGSGLAYSTFLGGDSASDTGLGLAVNADRFAVVTGYTFLGPDFPTTAGAFDTTYNDDPAAIDGEDAIVAKFDLSTEGPAGDPTCSDGFDNDGDGDADLGDPACQSPEGPAGDPSCANGVDDDGDGNADLADTDCQSPEGPPGDPSCADGVDNDGDGLSDGADPDCIAPVEGPPGDPTCSDGFDNDGDGATDLADAGCQSPEGPPGSPSCSDGVDNDADGATDLADSECQAPEGPVGDPSCTDGIDNDGDGGADLADSDCQQPEGPPGDPTCSDGIDNDNDGAFDQGDAGCQSPEGPAGDPTCSDGIDNDNDGNVDALDDGCQAVPPGVRCDGLLATVAGTTGTAGDDVIIGTPGPDTIRGRGGNDRICGRGGDDTLNGGAGDDLVLGQMGADLISGGMGADRLTGGVADDRLDGGRGDDKVIGNEGDDRLSGGPDTDLCDGRAGTDRASATCEVIRGVP